MLVAPPKRRGRLKGKFSRPDRPILHRLNASLNLAAVRRADVPQVGDVLLPRHAGRDHYRPFALGRRLVIAARAERPRGIISPHAEKINAQPHNEQKKKTAKSREPKHNPSNLPRPRPGVEVFPLLEQLTRHPVCPVPPQPPVPHTPG